MREVMSKTWSTEDLLIQDKRKPMVCHHRLNHCPFKCLLRFFKRRLIIKKLIRFIKLSPCAAWIFEKSHKSPWSTQGKFSVGSIRKTSETRPEAMTLIDQMVSPQPGIIPQVTKTLTHSGFWAATVFVDHYSNYCYSRLVMGTSAEKTLQSKEAYEPLAATHGTMVCVYRLDKGRFSEPLFKEAVYTCG